MMCVNKMTDHQKAELLKLAYPQGTRIKLYYMKGENDMEYGLTGSVKHVDDIGQIHMKWDNGRSLAINTDTDSFSVIQ